MANPFKRRLTAQDIPGYAGGALQDEIDRLQNNGPQWDNQSKGVPLADQGKYQPQPNPQLLTPRNQEAITRPRTVEQPQVPDRPRMVNPQPSDPNESRQRAVSFDAQTGKPNEDFYRNRNDIEGLYNAEQNWQPHGAKRGFKNSLKAGLMTASDAIRNNPDHPVEAALAGFGVGAVGATASPNFKNRLTREWKKREVGGQLQSQLALEKEKAQTDALRVRPQIQQDAQNEREVNNALTQYNRAESYDPDDPSDAGLKYYFESRGLKLPKKDKYHRPVATWANGKLILTDASGTHQAEIKDENGNVQPVSDIGRTPNEVGLTPNQQAATNRDTANRTSRERQFGKAETGRNERARLERLNSRGNALIVAGGRVAAMGDPELAKNQGDEAEADAVAAQQDIDAIKNRVDANGKPLRYGSDAQRIAQLSRERDGHKKQANDYRTQESKIRGARNGVKGSPVQSKTKWSPTPAFRKLFKERNGREPTQVDIDRYAAAAQQ